MQRNHKAVTESRAPDDLLSTCHDVIIVGAGVVGCAMARRFVLQGARVLVVEQSGDVLAGASKGNSAILHTGFDAIPGSLEQACIESGYREFRAISEALGLAILETSALVVAWSQQDEEQLLLIREQAAQNNVSEVSLLTAKQLAQKEPQLSGSALAALEIKQESVIDPWTTPQLYLLQALENGASLMRGATVQGGEFDGSEWQLSTSRGTVRGNCVINCAGLYGDNLDRVLLGRSSFQIKPRKGQFVVFDKTAAQLVNAIILPVPNEITKGVVVCKTIFGNLLVGPTAEEQDSREDTSVDRENLQQLIRRGVEIIPELAAHQVTATYAGIRPATGSKDYCINTENNRHYISVGGIRSTGLSAALGIATHVFGLYKGFGPRHRKIKSISLPLLTPIAEHGERDWKKPGNGGVVCHCELVTRREIETALQGPLAASSLAALKRRTRVTMGRCQGFYCSAELSEITAGHFDCPIGLADVRR